ncbi:uncharacterized protein LOC143911348 isoform X2 [Arctopsyche grandis]|uniref:uncharacterized protein LOC143911348 isoform X2 n=1 Tax=Arctopsyche grandis TaxID=121162 RepID=UPI00406D72F9
MSKNQKKNHSWNKTNIEISSCIHHKHVINKHENKENQINIVQKNQKKKIPLKNQINNKEYNNDVFEDCLAKKIVRKPLNDICHKEFNIHKIKKESVVENDKYVYERFKPQKFIDKEGVSNLPDIPEERFREIDESLNPLLQHIYEDLNPVIDKPERITTQRHYDTLNMTDLSLELKTNWDTFNIAKQVCTPANSFVPQTQIKAIKEIRKAFLKANNLDVNDIELEQSASKKIELNSNSTSKLKINDKKQNEMKRRHLYVLAGAVNLDSQENFVYHSVLYSTPYLNYICAYQCRIESKNRLTNTFLKKFSVTNLNRSIVINWLIKLQAYMKTEHVLIHTAVRMMDRTLDVIDIPINKLQLVALASFWISLKFHAVHQKDVSWMVKQSDGACTRDQLILMERTVFQANNFNVNPIDQSIYIHYYTFNLQITNPDIIAQCSHYILDCALLDCQFIHTLPSMMAAAAVFTSLYLLNQYNEKSWLRLHIYNGFYFPKELNPIKSSFVEMLREMNNPLFQCREPFKKYSSVRYYDVANIVTNALKNIDTQSSFYFKFR